MKLFLSWSGELSKNYATIIKVFLENCIQSLEVFLSTEDIQKGENWISKVSNELQNTGFGIICLTSENVNAPWLHFEAGSLYKSLESRVATLAINIPISDIQGPLKSFQCTKLEKKDILGLIETINKNLEKPLTSSKLSQSFEAFWTSFEMEVNKLKKQESDENSTVKKSNLKFNMPEAIEEILSLLRRQNFVIDKFEHESSIRPVPECESKYLLDEIFDFLDCLVSNIRKMESKVEILELCTAFIERVCRKNKSLKRNFYYIFEKIKMELEILSKKDF